MCETDKSRGLARRKVPFRRSILMIEVVVPTVTLTLGTRRLATHLGELRHEMEHFEALKALNMEVCPKETTDRQKA